MSFDAAVVSVAKSDAIAVVTIDLPPVNALSAAVRRGLLKAFGDVARDGSVAGIVLACAGRTFAAGADIAEFGTDAFAEADLNDVCAAIEALDKPVVCALHGTALGGGMELALACHYSVAAASALLGFPEFTLGLLPGAGGTQRVPRLVRAADALDMILSGMLISAAIALDKGLIDAVVEGVVAGGAALRPRPYRGARTTSPDEPARDRSGHRRADAIRRGAQLW